MNPQGPPLLKDVHESTALFHILDDGDGGVTLDEFIDGMVRCKGPARAIDQASVRRNRAWEMVSGFPPGVPFKTLPVDL